MEGVSSRKRRIKAEVSSAFKSKKTKKSEWKHRFVCLAYVDEYKVPTSGVQKDDLFKAGLGEKVIEFPTLEASAEEMRDLIYSTFPKLKDGKGFKLCRCLPNSRQLEPLSTTAYSSPALLKERVGNSRTYVLPLQKDLGLDDIIALPQGVRDIHYYVCVKYTIATCAIFVPVILILSIIRFGFVHLFRLKKSA